MRVLRLLVRLREAAAKEMLRRLEEADDIDDDPLLRGMGKQRANGAGGAEAGYHGSYGDGRGGGGGGGEVAPPPLREDEEGPEAPLEGRRGLQPGEEGANESDEELMHPPGRPPPVAFMDPNVPMRAGLGGRGDHEEGHGGEAREKRKEGMRKMEKAIEKLKHIRVAVGAREVAAGAEQGSAGAEKVGKGGGGVL